MKILIFGLFVMLALSSASSSKLTQHPDSTVHSMNNLYGAMDHASNIGDTDMQQQRSLSKRHVEVVLDLGTLPHSNYGGSGYGYQSHQSHYPYSQNRGYGHSYRNNNAYGQGYGNNGYGNYNNNYYPTTGNNGYYNGNNQGTEYYHHHRHRSHHHHHHQDGHSNY